MLVSGVVFFWKKLDHNQFVQVPSLISLDFFPSLSGVVTNQERCQLQKLPATYHLLKKLTINFMERGWGVPRLKEPHKIDSKFRKLVALFFRFLVKSSGHRSGMKIRGNFPQKITGNDGNVSFELENLFGDPQFWDIKMAPSSTMEALSSSSLMRVQLEADLHAAGSGSYCEKCGQNRLGMKTIVWKDQIFIRSRAEISRNTWKVHFERQSETTS